MRRVSFILAAMLAVATASAEAQSSVTGPYAEFTTGFAGSSGLFGGEAGLRLNTWDVYFEGGRLLNTKTSEMDAAASVIATQFLSAGGRTATFETKQPVNYFDVGVRYKFPPTGRLLPYVALGVGGAKVSRSVTFAVNGTDVTGQLEAMGVLLGGDLSGSESAALFTLGGGAQFDLGDRFFVDVSYRYGRIFLTDSGLNTNRLQIGFGARF